MRNQDYVKPILSKYDSVLIDTSALMNDEYFQRFVENYEMTLLEYGKKIFVSRSVWAELLRMYNGRDAIKQEKAAKAICIINMHKNIFLIDGREIREEEIWTAFADKDLLSDLTKNITRRMQLLITNDGKLANDALSLNNLESCQGRRVDVCRLQYSGDLSSFVLSKSMENPSSEPQLIIREVEKPVYIKQPTEHRSSAVQPILYASFFAGGFCFAKHGKYVFNVLTQAVKKLL